MSLTEQICTNNTLGCVGHKDGKCHSIENCKYKVEQPVITIGDKIRESNESLAEFIKQYNADLIDDCYCRKLCEHRVDGSCELDECDRYNYNGIMEYLNQPYTGKE